MLPPEVVEFLDHLRASGVDERIVRVERDGWIPLVARSPERVERDEAYLDDTDIEPPFAELMDTLAFDAAPPARRLIELLEQRGWTGWTRLERVRPTRR